MLAKLTTYTSINENVKGQLDSANSLYTLLWNPIKKSIGDIAQVIVSPDGILNLVPFGAFRSSQGKYIIENKTITYVTSGRDLLRGKGALKPEIDLFLAANPRFDIEVKASTDVGIQRG